MKHLKTCSAILALAISQASYAQVTVNPSTASYANLQLAFDAINAGTHVGAVTIGITADVSDNQSAILNASGTGAASYSSIVMTPVGARTLNGVFAGALVDLNGADNVTIDGLNAAGNSLTINNQAALATSGISTIRFVNGASNNTITNATILGAGSMAVATNGGNIYFATDGVATTGNDSNIISNNNIGPSGPTTLPSKAIYCNGTTTNTAVGNSNITISNNNVFDYFQPAVTSAGVFAGAGCNTWTISNNRFYQTATRTWTTGSNHRAIELSSSAIGSGIQGMTVTGNTIGYSSNAQTGTYTMTGSSGKFGGILLSAISASGPGAANVVSNNTIANVSLTSGSFVGASTSSPIFGILINNGPTTSSNNIIGGLTFNSTTTAATDVYGIYNFSGDNATADNNSISGITAQTSATTLSMIVYGLRFNTGTAVFANALGNTIGGATSNSILNTTSSSTAQVIGIASSNAIANWRANTIRNLSATGGTGTSATASVIGAVATSTSSVGHVIERNIIEKLSNSNPTLATVVVGLHFTSGTTGPSTLARNNIRQLSTASALGTVNGIGINGGIGVYRNNMIRLGQDVVGADITLGASINGIAASVGTDSFFNNTVLIQGAGVGGSVNTFAMNNSQTFNTRFFQNNIFYNARSNGAGTGKHYAYRVGGSAPNPAGLTSNNNQMFVDGTGGVLGLYNNVDQANLAAWQAATGQDAASISSNPLLVSSTDLHLTSASPARNAGVTLAGVTDDFDGKSRPGANALYDIGADEFDGIAPVANDMRAQAFVDPTGPGVRAINVAFAPQASFNNVGTANQTNVTVRYRILNGAVEVYNQTSVIASLNSSAQATVTFAPATITTAGNYTIFAKAELAGDGVPANDEISSTLFVSGPLAGNYTIGSGGNFASITNGGGMFQALNVLGASANVSFDIISDISNETGANALNQLPAGITVLIKPSGAARTVSGSSTGALIALNGADNVTIDGSLSAGTAADVVGGTASLRNLSISNLSASTSAGVILISSGTAGAQNNTVKNVNVIGADATTTLAGISAGGATVGATGADNDVLRVENCSVRKVVVGIFSSGTSGINPNLANVITKNDLTGAGADRVRRLGIFVSNQDAPIVSFNAVANLDTNEGNDAVGIGIGAQSFDSSSTSSGGVVGALVTRNLVSGVLSQSTIGFSAGGIAVAGGAGAANVISNNMISGISAPATPSDLVAGIFVAGVTGSNTRLLYNSISLNGSRGAVNGQNPSFGIAISGTDPTVELRNNAIVNNLTVDPAATGAAAAKSFAIGMAATTFVNLNANFNSYFSSGSQSAGFRTGSLGITGSDIATLAAWQTATADDANSLQLDPLFVSALDLHLQAASPALNLGTPLAGITVDIDGDARSATTPEIGADELLSNTAPVITPNAAGLTRQQGSLTSNGNIAVVSDAEQAAGTLTVTAPSVPLGLSVAGIANAAGIVTADVAATCTASLGANSVGLSVSDGSLTGAGNLTVNVTANTAPVQGSYANTAVTLVGGATVTPTAVPTDNGSIATVTAAAPGFTGTLGVNSAGVVTLSNAGPIGIFTVTVTATDNCGTSSSAGFTLSITSANGAPTLTPLALSRSVGSSGTAVAIGSTTDDSGNGLVTLSVNGGASATVNGVTVSNLLNSSGSLSADVVLSCSAINASFTLRATDVPGLFVEAPLNVTVTANTPPVLSYASSNAVFGQALSINPTSGPNDNGSVTNIAVQSAGTFTGTSSVNTAGVVSLGNARPVGSHSLTIRATDNCASSTDANLALIVALAQTSTVIAADTPDPSLVGQPVLVSYTVAVTAPGSGTPTGNVTISDGVNSCTASVGTGQCTIMLMTAGNRTLTATYAGSAEHATSASTDSHLVLADAIFANGFEDPINLQSSPQ